MLKLKLKLGILECFIFLLVVLFVADLCLNYYEEQHREKAAFTRYFEHISSSIYSEINRLTHPAEQIVDISRRFYNAKSLNFYDYKALNNFFISFMNLHPYITSINLGDDKGYGYLILRLGNVYKNRIKKAELQDKVVWIYLNETGEEIKSEVVSDDYDPRNRPWYNIAKDNSSINWSSPYVFRTTKDVGITASCNLSSEKTKKMVIGLDIMLKDLSRYLFQINNAYKDSKIRLISQDGKIFASSEEGFEDFLKKDDPSLLTLTQNRDKLFYNAFKTYFREKANNFILNLDGERHFVFVKNLELSTTEKLLLFISLPESTFLVHYKQSAGKKAVLYLIILVISGFFVLKRYLIPLRNLSTAIGDFSEKGYQHLPYGNRHDEVGVIAAEFSNLVKQVETQQNQLKISEKSYRLLFESNPLPFLIVDEENLNILEANNAAAKLYGASREQLTSLTLDDLQKKKEKEVKLKIDDTTKGILTHKKFDGSPVYVEIYSNSIVWKDRAALLILCIDISQRLILEEQLRQSQNLERIGILAGGIAHEFNNILAAILGYASLIELKMNQEDPQLKNVREIIKATQKAAKLVSEMLAFSRKQILDIKKINLNDVIYEFLPTIKTILGKQNVVEVVLSSTPLHIKADKNRLEQVLLNLAINARDAMPNYGKVTLITNKILIKQEHFPTLSDGYYALIEFSDTGRGMDEHTKKHIFDPFFTTKEVGKGTGLGLSVVYGIIRQHHGEIKVESAVNQGTTFFIYLPLYE